MRIRDYIPAMAEKCTSFAMRNPGKIALVAAVAASCFAILSLGSALKRAQELDRVDEFGNPVRSEEPSLVAEKPPHLRCKPIKPPLLATIVEEHEEEDMPASPRKNRKIPTDLRITVPEPRESPKPLSCDVPFEDALGAVKRNRLRERWGDRFVGDKPN
jgi:hypothetical protein